MRLHLIKKRMKKNVLLFLFVLVAFGFSNAQTTIIAVDGAAQGAGTNHFNYSGAGWVHGTGTSDPYFYSTASYSNQTGNFVTIQFTGSKIEFYTSTASHHGIAAVSIDNNPEIDVDLYSQFRQSFVMVYSTGTLNHGNHTLKIRVKGTKNPLSSNRYVIVDYVHIFSGVVTNTSYGVSALFANTSGYNNTANGYQALMTNTEGSNNTAFGTVALVATTTGVNNTAIGSISMANNSTGINNTALGHSTLAYNTIGGQNTALGAEAIFSNTGGSQNTAGGFQALYSNTTGSRNTSFGATSLHSNVTGQENSAFGFAALVSNTEGKWNTASGYQALSANTWGAANSAFGTESMKNNVSGEQNSAFGYFSLLNNIYGNYNTAIGIQTLAANASGDNNAALGASALTSNTTGSINTGVGAGALYWNETGNYNTGVGAGAGPATGQTNLTNATAIGANALNTASNQVRIGDSYVTSIGGKVSWSTLSDGRFKKDVKEDVSGLAFIEKLRPVSYVVDDEAVSKFLKIPDSVRNVLARTPQKSSRQTGFVAQEVESVIKKSGLVFHGVEVPQNDSEHYSIRYAEFVVPLVKAVQELNTIVKQQQLESVEQKLEITSLKEQLKAYDGATNNGLSETETVLYQNNPNPFSTDTEIKMELSESAVNAVVIVYNLEGKQLKDVRINGRGKTSVKIAGSELNAGMYLYALIVDGKVVDTKRMILTK
jgi:trimeric autotransporter adhesin